MTKIARATQKIFGSNAGVNQIAEFGSLAAGSIAYTTDPTTIQSLGNYLTGWFGAVVGYSPAIEDMNALCFLYAYQLAYLMQAGIAEWDAGTTYYIGSFASDGVGGIYTSLTDGNINHALTSSTNWVKSSGSNLAAINPATDSPYTLAAGDTGKTFKVNTANGGMVFNLPVPILNYSFSLKDSAGLASLNSIVVQRHSSESIEGLAANYTCEADYGTWTFTCDGTNWFITR